MADHDEALLALLRTDEAPGADTIRSRQNNGPAPLSFAQQRLWFRQRYALPAPIRAQSGTNGEALLFMDGLRSACEQGAPAPAHGEGLPG